MPPITEAAAAKLGETPDIVGYLEREAAAEQDQLRAFSLSKAAGRLRELAGLETAVARWRVRRHAWFCLYYRSRPARSLPPGADDEARANVESAGAWSSICELDHVLDDCEAAGLIPKGWQSQPPIVPDYHGGIAEDELRARLNPEDLAALGLH